MSDQVLEDPVLEDPVLEDDPVLEEFEGFNLEDGTDGIPEVVILEEIDIDDDQDDIEEVIDLVSLV